MHPSHLEYLLPTFDVSLINIFERYVGADDIADRFNHFWPLKTLDKLIELLSLLLPSTANTSRHVDVSNSLCASVYMLVYTLNISRFRDEKCQTELNYDIQPFFAVFYIQNIEAEHSSNCLGKPTIILEKKNVTFDSLFEIIFIFFLSHSLSHT